MPRLDHGRVLSCVSAKQRHGQVRLSKEFKARAHLIRSWSFVFSLFDLLKQVLPIMAPTKTLELCNKITTQGNSISIRLLEYLSSSKNPVHGIQAFASEFLELSRLIWSIEAGLTESSHKKRNIIPTEVTQELDKHFRRISDEFIVVNQMMLKFLDNETKKGGFGRAFRMMFADTDVDKVRNTLAKSRDALKVSSAMFRWSLGDAKADSQMGIGYTGLVAALDRLNPGKSNILLPMQPPPTSAPPEVPSKQVAVHAVSVDHRSVDQPTLQRAQLGGGLEHFPSHSELPRPLTPLRDRPSVNDFRKDDHREDSAISSGIIDLHNNWRRAPSVRSSSTAHSIHDTMYLHNGQHHGQSGYSEHLSDDSRSRAYLDDDLHHLSLQERFSVEQAHARQLDGPISPSQWTPRQQNGSIQSSGKGALAEAVFLKKHRILEQILDGGARVDPRLLRTAIQNRDVESLALLLRYGANANNIDKDEITPLFAATDLSFFDGAKLLLRSGADPNLSAGPNSETPFCLAACENRIDLAQLMLTHGGDAGLIMENGNTAFIQCMNKTVSPRLVELLLKAGADANAKNGEGATALFQAIQANRVDLMTILLDNGANPNLPGPKHPLWPSTYKPKALQLMLSRGADSKKTPGIMELASSLKKLESIEILMQAGVSPNVRKDGIYTPLCSAIRDNSADIVTYLLEHGADPNLNAAEYPAFKCITHDRVHFLPQLQAAGVDLRSPKGIIETAVAHNNKEALMWLLDQGLSPNDRSPQGNTPLSTAIRDERIEMVEILLAKGADPSIRGADWPLCMAVKQPAILKKLLPATPNPRAFKGIIEMAVVANQLDSIKMLLGAGLSVEDKNCGVFSPLTTAIRERHKHIVRYLLDEANADPNAPGEHLPLVKALRRLLPGDTEILQMLLTRGADINKMHRGWNAVLQAVENGDADILRMLIDKGGSVDLQAIDENGRPVIDIISERGWEEGMSLLFPNAHAEQRQ